MREDLFFKLAAFLLVFLFFFLPPLDTDLGWHLRYGNHFLKTGKIMKENKLTYFLPGYRWSHSYSLYQIVTALIYKTGGAIALSVGYGLLLAGVYLIMAGVNPGLPRANLFFLIGTWLLAKGVFNLGWRSQIFSILFLCLVFYFLKKGKRNKKLRWTFPFLFTVWANIHGGFVLGLTVIGFFIFQKLLDKNYKQARLLFLILFLSALAGLLNPFGIGVYKEAVRHIFYPLENLIAEWVPPLLWVRGAIILIGSFTLFSLFLFQEKEKVFWLICVLVFSYLGLNARRNVPLFALVSCLALVEVFKEELLVLKKYLKKRKIGALAASAGFLLLLFFRFPETYNIDINPARLLGRYPLDTAQYIENNPLKGENIFSAYEWGGFLEWRLPQYKYFVDGRMPVWPTKSGKSPYTVYLETLQTQPGYQKTLDKHNTDYLLIGKRTFLALELEKGNNKIWEKIYEGEKAVLFSRR